MALSGATTVRTQFHARPHSLESRRWLSWGDRLTVWPGRRLVRVGRRIANLTRGEFALLELLARENGEPVTRAELVRAIRRGTTSPTSRTVRLSPRSSPNYWTMTRRRWRVPLLTPMVSPRSSINAV